VSDATVDVVLPVLNEEHCVERNLNTLARHLGTRCPHDWMITVVDNGSTDRTWPIVTTIAESNPRVRPIRLDRSGRGRALKAAWSTSTADVVAYMDIDLSTRLEALAGLIDPIVNGRADVSIGSRRARDSKVERSAKREVISRIYNLITRAAFGYDVSDAQCGFKAVRADVARKLIPQIQDDGWFFDTELLVSAWRSGLRITEVPVRWIEDDDSRVTIVRTATDDLRGIWRLCRAGGWRRGPSGPYLIGRTGVPTEQWVDLDASVQPTFDFDAHATDYVAAVDRSVSFTGRDSAFFAERKVQLLKSLARLYVGELGQASVLDVGCGAGTTDRYLVEQVGSLCGVDVSEEMLALARQKVKGARFEWYDGEKLPYPDGAFDIVVAICVLHHVPPPRRPDFLAELNRVARVGGLIVVFEHNPANPLTRRAVNSCELDHGVSLVWGRRAASLLQDAGADVLARVNFLFTPFGGRFGPAVDSIFRPIPLGAQYAVLARVVHH
jgi:SAM-dependent methyltransferase/glycosyltransferase involved in cell wall biosynthesis